MIATDSLKSLAKRYGTSVAWLRDAATDLGLDTAYDYGRSTWVVNEDARTVRTFNDMLAAEFAPRD